MLTRGRRCFWRIGTLWSRGGTLNRFQRRMKRTLNTMHGNASSSNAGPEKKTLTTDLRSSSGRVNLLELVSLCVNTAETAGKVCRDVFASGDLFLQDKDVLSGQTQELRVGLYKERSESSKDTKKDEVSLQNEEKVADPVTVADIRAQGVIYSCLKRCYPDLELCGEEEEEAVLALTGIDKYGRRVDQKSSSSEPPTVSPPPAVLDVLKGCAESLPSHLLDADVSDFCVYVDPLDATREYSIGFVDAVTVLIGITYKGEPVAGVVHVPFSEPDSSQRRRTVFGITSLGVWGAKNVPSPSSQKQDISTKQNTSTKQKPEQEQGTKTQDGGAQEKGKEWVLATSRSRSSTYLESIIKDVWGPSQVKRAGGAGNKGLMVLDGKADVYGYPARGTKKWDTCAIDACMRAAGGVIVDCFGEPLGYPRPSQVSEDDKKDSGRKYLENKKGLLAAMDVELLKPLYLPANGKNKWW